MLNPLTNVISWRTSAAGNSTATAVSDRQRKAVRIGELKGFVVGLRGFDHEIRELFVVFRVSPKTGMKPHPIPVSYPHKYPFFTHCSGTT
jgi:hypothetical protein